MRKPQQFEFKHVEFTGFGGDKEGEDSKLTNRSQSAHTPAQTFTRPERKIGRNEPCPCKSGKKYKHCCGKAT